MPLVNAFLICVSVRFLRPVLSFVRLALARHPPEESLAKQSLPERNLLLSRPPPPASCGVWQLTQPRTFLTKYSPRAAGPGRPASPSPASTAASLVRLPSTRGTSTS